jgi:cyclophilin family peptidyl-prolyl cis-trans isomerase
MTGLLLIAASSLMVLPLTVVTQKQETPGEVKEYGVLETNFGTIEFELYRRDAPRTVENFVGLAGKKYYDGVTFHRIARGFVIQGGDPTRTGGGGESLWKEPFEDELDPSTPSYRAGYQKGVVAMANRGPNTNTSQFFILLDDAPKLPKNYTIFGKVTRGMEVVETIGGLEIKGPRAPYDGQPAEAVIMKTVRIRRGTVPAPAGTMPPTR